MVGTLVRPAAQSVFPDWPASWGVRPKYVTLASPERRTYGPAIARVAARLGGSLFPWQRYLVSLATEQVADGLGGFEPAFDQVIVLATRRSGKTFMVKAVSVERGLRGRSRIAFTAQTRDEAATRWKEIADNVSDLDAERGLRQVLGDAVHVTSGNSNEMLTFRSTGSQFFPFAPNEKAAHGGAWDLVFIDEVWAHSLQTKRQIQQGYRPMWSVKPGQEWLFSAAGTHASSWLHEMRRTGRASVSDPDSRIAFIEFGVPDDADVFTMPDAELIRMVLEHHPRRGYGLREGYLRSELSELGRAGFLRAYANRDSEDDEAGVLSADVRKRQTADVRIPRGAVCSVGVALDDARRESTVAMAWGRDDGSMVVESKTEPGVRWVASYVAHAPGIANVAVSNSRLGRGCADEIERVWAESSDLDAVPVLRVSAADGVAAAGEWLAGVEESGQVFFELSPALRVALGSADLPVGGRWVSRTGEPITAVEAHTMAVWALGHRPVVVAPGEFWVF